MNYEGFFQTSQAPNRGLRGRQLLGSLRELPQLRHERLIVVTVQGFRVVSVTDEYGHKVGSWKVVADDR
jgi:hypothetical protein